MIQSVRDRSSAAPAVSCVWVQEVSEGSDPFAHRRAPTGSAELICVLGATPRVLGPGTGAVETWLAPGTVIVGVRLRPSAAAAALGLPASELLDQDVELDELWRGSGERLGEALANAATPDEAAMLLERTVTGAPDPVVAEVAGRLLEGQSLPAIAASLYISERQLRRRCVTAAGMTPKILHRILRFQRFLALAWRSERPTAELARLAHEAGYADQAHLTREAVRLEGRSPRVFLAESGQRCGCGHDHAASYGPLLPA